MELKLNLEINVIFSYETLHLIVYPSKEVYSY